MTAKKDSETKKKQETLQFKLKKFEKEIKQLKQDLEDKNDKLLRSYADFQNYQKRMEKELVCKEDETKKKYLSELIDLYELLKIAYGDEKPKDGLKLILNNVEKIFEKEQIKHIDCVGKTFNHNIHHAISTIEDDCEDETIVEEVKKGYLIADKVLRPSQVIVAKKKEKL